MREKTFISYSSVYIILVTFIAHCLFSPMTFSQAISTSFPESSLSGLESFNPMLLEGIIINPKQPFRFDFIVSQGDDILTAREQKESCQDMIKYFLASLAIPEKDQWVNLSPYEKNRIIQKDFGETRMGRDLLEQDYVLKQLMASLIHPDRNIGKDFWQGIYAKAQASFGTTDIPVNAFNKVWITPDEAVVHEDGNIAVIHKSHLIVIAEKDYAAMKHNILTSGVDKSYEGNNTNQADTIVADMMREIILPALEKEVNTGRTFAKLRQMVNGMILAAWFKKTLKASLVGRIYADQRKIKGVYQNPVSNQIVYQNYIESFREGVFDIIREDINTSSGEVVPHRYFSGGFVNNLTRAEGIIQIKTVDRSQLNSSFIGKTLLKIAVALKILSPEKRGGRKNIDLVSGSSEEMVRKKLYPFDNLQKKPWFQRHKKFMINMDKLGNHPVLDLLREAEEKIGVKIWITGGVIRDILSGKETLRDGGDIDFFVETNADTMTQEGVIGAAAILEKIADLLHMHPQDFINYQGEKDGVVIDFLGLINPETGQIIAKNGLERYFGSVRESVNTLVLGLDGQGIDFFNGKVLNGIKNNKVHFLFQSNGSEKEIILPTLFRMLRFKYQGFSFDQRTSKIIEKAFHDDTGKYPDLQIWKTWLKKIDAIRRYRSAKLDGDFQKLIQSIDDFILAFGGKDLKNVESAGLEFLTTRNIIRIKDDINKGNFDEVVASFEYFMNYEGGQGFWPMGENKVIVNLTAGKHYDLGNDPLGFGLRLKDMIVHAHERYLVSGISGKSVLEEDLERTGLLVFFEASGINVGDEIAKWLTVKQSGQVVAVNENQLPYGGIDLNSGNMNMRIQRTHSKTALFIAQQDSRIIRLDGLVPVITGIQPINSISELPHQ